MNMESPKTCCLCDSCTFYHIYQNSGAILTVEESKRAKQAARTKSKQCNPILPQTKVHSSTPALIQSERIHVHLPIFMMHISQLSYPWPCNPACFPFLPAMGCGQCLSPHKLWFFFLWLYHYLTAFPVTSSTLLRKNVLISLFFSFEIFLLRHQ